MGEVGIAEDEIAQTEHNRVTGSIVLQVNNRPRILPDVRFKRIVRQR